MITTRLLTSYALLTRLMLYMQLSVTLEVLLSLMAAA